MTEIILTKLSGLLDLKRGWKKLSLWESAVVKV